MDDKQGGESWPVELKIDVAWGDMDSFAHVNNVVYLRWFESARIRFFERAQMMQRMKTERVGPILARTSCDYRRPVAYPDTVTVKTRCTRVGGKSFDMAYEVTSHALGGVCATGDCVIVMCDYKSGAAVQIDDTLRVALELLG
jgi:acyl-CoA thioester hydrolase